MAVHEKQQQATDAVKDVMLKEKIAETSVSSIYQADFDKKPGIIEIFSDLDESAKRAATERAAIVEQLYAEKSFEVRIGQSQKGALTVALVGLESSLLSQKMAQWRTDVGRPQTTEIISMLQAIGDLLIHANQLGLLHQNLSPSTIAVTEDMTPILLGLATPPGSVQSEGRHIEVSSYQVYLDYISPEQAQGNGVMVQSHIYTLGIILYELLADTRPRLPVSRWDVFELEWLPKETSLREVRQDLQEETYLAVAGCLWRRPWDRPDSIEDLQALLTAAFEAEQSPKKEGLALPLPPTQLAIIGAVLAVIFLLGFLFLRGGQNNVSTAGNDGNPAIIADLSTDTPEPTATMTPTAEPTETPTALPTATPGTVIILGPQANQPLPLGEPVQLEWQWDQATDGNAAFFVYLITNETETAVTESIVPTAQGTYSYILETESFTESDSYSWYVALQGEEGQQIALSAPQALTFALATATSTATVEPTSTIAPTITNTPEPTSTPQCIVSPPPGWTRYAIQAGDSLYQIAVEANYDPEYVLGINCVTADTILSIGQQVWIPVPPATETPIPSPTPESTGGDSGGNGGGNGGGGGGGGGGNPAPPRATATPPPPPGG